MMFGGCIRPRFDRRRWPPIPTRNFRKNRVANRAARQLAQNLQSEANVEIVFPVQANAVFARMDDQLVRGLHARGWRFYKFIEPDVYRLMCSWATTESDIGDFIRDVTLNH